MKAISKKAGGKVSTANDPDKPLVAVVAPDDDEPATTTSGAEIVADIEDVPASKASATPIPASIAEADTLEVVFLEELLDYPIIGRFNFQREFRLTRIRKHQKFVVPRDVALTLYDKGLVTIPSMVN